MSFKSQPVVQENKGSISFPNKVDELLEEILYSNHHTTVEKIATLKQGVRKLNSTQRKRFRKVFKKRSKNIHLLILFQPVDLDQKCSKHFLSLLKITSRVKSR